jgi:DNA-binding transcriptional ArsR family regulator
MKSTSMKQIVESGNLKRFIDPRIVEALKNPVREHALAIFNERIASATQIGEEIGADVSLFYHHIEVLERLGCIELVETKRNRGGTERFYKATSTLLLDEKTWELVPESIKSDFSANITQSIFDEIIQALLAGTLNTSGEEHVSWTPARFDDVGWVEARDLMAETLERLTAIQERSAERLFSHNESGTGVTVAILGFETPKGGAGPSTAS